MHRRRRRRRRHHRRVYGFYYFIFKIVPFSSDERIIYIILHTSYV